MSDNEELKHTTTASSWLSSIASARGLNSGALVARNAVLVSAGGSSFGKYLATTQDQSLLPRTNSEGRLCHAGSPAVRIPVTQPTLPRSNNTIRSVSLWPRERFESQVGARGHSAEAYSLARRSSCALIATMTVLADMSTAANAGGRRMPCVARIPAANGIATML